MKNDDNICLNCDHRLHDELYCPQCGQKARIKNLSLRYLLSTFYVAFLDFDKKLLRSLRDIWIPNKISENFLSGGRQTYVNHIRFFVVCLATCLALIAIHLKRADLSGMEDLQKSGIKAGMKDQFQDFRTSLEGTCDTLLLDSLSTLLFGSATEGHDYEINDDEEEDDEKEDDDEEEDEETVENLDTTGTITDTILMDSNGNAIAINIPRDGKDGEFKIGDKTYNVYDIYNISTDSIFAKYEIVDFRKQFFIKQGIKTFKNGGSALGFFISNMLWGIILVTILMAFALKLLYVMHNSFYVEHLMHMINFHCVFLIGLSVLMIIGLFTTVSVWFYLILILLSGLYLCLSLKRYFRQSWFKTIVKGFLISQAYLLAFSLVIFLILGISFAFF